MIGKLVNWGAAGTMLVLAGCSKEHTVGGDPTVSDVQYEARPATAGTMPPIVDLAPDASQLAKIRVQPVEATSVVVDEVSSPGSIEANPNRISQISLPVAGRVAEVFVKLGDVVTPSQPLLSIESPEIESAELAYRQSENALAQAKANEVKTQFDVDRLTDLFAHQAVAQKELIATQNSLTLAKISVQEAEAARQQTLRRLDLMSLKPGDFGQKMIIRSPLAGKVLALSVVAGEYRNDLSAHMVTIADLRTVWASSNVPETYIRNCRIGGRVLIELVAFPGEQFDGRVSQIADSVDPETRTIKVRAELNNSSGRFRPEMYGRIRYGEAKQVLPTLPQSAILQNEGQLVIYVEEKPGHFVRRAISTGKQVGDLVVVREGLRAGERVVVSGAIHMKGGI